MKKISVFTGEDGFNQIKNSWFNLAIENADHFTHYPGWYEANIIHYPDFSVDCFFITIHEDNVLNCVIPVEKKYIGSKFLNLYYLQLFYPNEMGVCDISVRRGYIIDLDSLRKKIREYFPNLLFIRLQHFLEDSHCVKSLLSSHSQFSKACHCPAHLSFPKGYEDFFSAYNKKFIRNIRRLANKANENGQLRLECANCDNTLPEAFEVFLNLEDSGWKGRNGTSIKKIDALNKYYTHFIQTNSTQTQCQINILYCGEEPIAGQFCLKANETLYLLKIGYNEKVSNISPGQLLIEHLIRYGSDTKEFNQIHFVTECNWMARWKPQQQTSYLAYISSHFLGSIIISLLSFKDKIKIILKKIKK